MSLADSDVPTVQSVRSRAGHTLRRWIADGTLAPGEDLASEHALAQQLKIGRSTVRLLLKQLEEEGAVIPQGQGKRRVVAPTAGKGATVLSGTVAILSGPPGGGSPPSWRATTGLQRHIEMGAVEALRAKGMHAMVLDSTRADEAEIRRLVRERLAGVIALHHVMTSEAGRRNLHLLRQGGVNVVGYGHAAEFDSYDTVASDHSAGTCLLAKWLIDRGRRRILFFCPQGDWPIDTLPGWVLERRRGYERALRDAGLQSLPTLVIPVVQSDNPVRQKELRAHSVAGYLAPLVLGNEPVDAIMSLSDGHVPSLVAALRILGKRPNHDVELVGYDNYWVDAVDLKAGELPPLATVDKLNIQLGQELIRLLFERLEKKLPPEPQHRLVAPQLIEVDARLAQQ